MWGGINFGLAVVLMMWAHFRLWVNPYGADWLACPAILLGFSWFGYFLTLMSVRLRHAGKVCSGDYLPDRL